MTELSEQDVLYFWLSYLYADDLTSCFSLSYSSFYWNNKYDQSA